MPAIFAVVALIHSLYLHRLMLAILPNLAIVNAGVVVGIAIIIAEARP